MPSKRPHPRTCRQFVDGSYAEGGRSRYIDHPKFAESPEHNIRAFLILMKDLRDLFDYVEPADKNLSCYSYRIHSLLVRACVEVEANCKAILKENGYAKSGDWNMSDYKKIETTHFLSLYEIRAPVWTGQRSTWTPFSAWGSGKSLDWYKAYNAAKHDRHSEFAQATFEQLIAASCGLLVLLSAQFRTNDFSPGNSFPLLEGPGDGMESGIGRCLRGGV